MPAEVASAFVSIVPSMRGFGRDLERQIGPASDRAGRTGGRLFGGTFARTSAGPIRSVVGMAKGPLLGAFAAVASVNVFKGFIDDARESAKVGAQTAQVIKTTGGAARISAKQVGNLATAISNKTGVDDEAIQSGANLLLTFTNVRNEVGKGNDIFNQATQTVTDMSAALGQDMKSSSIQLGKALNDPIKGVSALQRVGVSFTAQQKDQIKTLVGSGKTLDAQKIILRELGKEFGGTAAAIGTPMDKLKVAVGNIKESIGGALIPVVDAAANAFLRFLPTITAAATGVVRVLTPVRDAIVQVFDILTGRLDSGGVDRFFAISDAAQKVHDTFVRVLPVVQTFIGSLRDKLLPVFQAVGDFVRAHIQPILTVLSGALGGALLSAVLAVAGALGAALVGALGAVLGALAAPAVVIGALAGGLVVLYQHSERFRQIVTVVSGYLKANVLPVFQSVGAYVVTHFVPAMQAIGGFLVNSVFPALQKVGGFLVSTFTPTFHALSDYVTKAVLPALRGLFVRIQENLPPFIAFAKFVGVVVVIIAALAAKILGFLLPILLKLSGFMVTYLFAAIGKVIGIFGGVIRIVQSVVAAFQRLQTIVLEATRYIVTKFLDMAGDILHAAAHMLGWMGPLGGKLKAAAAEFDTFRNRVIASLDIPDQTVKVTAVGTFSDFTGAKKDRTHRGSGQALADGGLIRGPGGPRDDIIYNAVSNGEYVVNARQTRRHMGLLEAINAGRYASGGLVVDAHADARPLQRGSAAWFKSVRDQVRADGSRRAVSAFGRGPDIGGGVTRWAGLVLQVLGELGLSSNLLPRVLRQMQTESGGNPNATQGNIGDVNNRSGDLARGLMQVIGGTFRAFAGPYAGLGQYNPHASIYAGLNYAKHRYGSSLSFLGNGHGYAQGGLVGKVYDQGGMLEPGRIGVNLSSRPEAVLTGAQTAGLQAMADGFTGRGMRLDPADLDQLAFLLRSRPVELKVGEETLARTGDPRRRSQMAAAGLL